VAVVVVRCGAKLYAVEDRCTHDGSRSPERKWKPVRSSARGMVRTSAYVAARALTPPAYEPLRTYRAREQDGRVLLERPA